MLGGMCRLMRFLENCVSAFALLVICLRVHDIKASNKCLFTKTGDVFVKGSENTLFNDNWHKVMSYSNVVTTI